MKENIAIQILALTQYFWCHGLLLSALCSSNQGKMMQGKEAPKPIAM